MNKDETWQQKNQENKHEWFCGNQEAINFINGLFYCVELWDDLIDKDEVIEDKRINECFEWLFINLPANNWFISNRTAYLPVMKMAINSFYDANVMKSSKQKHLRNLAFHIRNSSTEVIILTTFLIGGEAHLRKYSQAIREWYAFEKFEEWK